MGLTSMISGIPDEDVEWAREIGKKYEGGYLGKGDAARHLALGYIAAKARFKGDYLFNPMALAQMREIGFSNLDNEMDRRNNELGFFISAMTDDKAEAEQIIDKMLQNVTEADGPKSAKASKLPVVGKKGVPGNNYY